MNMLTSKILPSPTDSRLRAKSRNNHSTQATQNSKTPRNTCSLPPHHRDPREERIPRPNLSRPHLRSGSRLRPRTRRRPFTRRHTLPRPARTTTLALAANEAIPALIARHAFLVLRRTPTFAHVRFSSRSRWSLIGSGKSCQVLDRSKLFHCVKPAALWTFLPLISHLVFVLQPGKQSAAEHRPRICFYKRRPQSDDDHRKHHVPGHCVRASCVCQHAESRAGCVLQIVYAVLCCLLRLEMQYIVPGPRVDIIACFEQRARGGIYANQNKRHRHPCPRQGSRSSGSYGACMVSSQTVRVNPLIYVSMHLISFPM